MALLSARSVPYEPKPSRRFDLACLVYCSAIGLFIVGLLGVCQYAALIKFWPYDLSFSLANYNFDVMDGGGWDSYFNSIRMALYEQRCSGPSSFSSAPIWWRKAERLPYAAGPLFQFLAMMPMADARAWC